MQQLRDVLGLRLVTAPPEFIERLSAYASNLESINPYAVGLSLATLLILMLWPKVSHRFPAPFVALILTTVAASCCTCRWRRSAPGSARSGRAFPSPSLPSVSLASCALVGPALAIALLGAVESLLSAVVADGMIGGRHRSNMELVAQGVANVVAPLFGGIPATGAIARTATNVKSGGRTPVAGMVHALTLLIITLFFGRLAAVIPLATLAAIVLVGGLPHGRVAGVQERAERAEERRDRDAGHLSPDRAGGPHHRHRRGHGAGRVSLHEADGRGHQHRRWCRGEFRTRIPSGDGSGAIFRRRVPPGVEVYEINGPFFFGAAEKFKDTLARSPGSPRS